MNKFNISGKLIETIQSLYENAMSAVMVQGATGEWFHTSVGVRQAGVPVLPNPLQLLSRGYHDTCPRELQRHHISIGDRQITNIRFADHIDGITGEEDELRKLVHNLDTAATKFGMEISAEKPR